MLTFNLRLDTPLHDEDRCARDRARQSFNKFDNHLIVDEVTSLANGFEIWVGEAADPFRAILEADVRISRTTSCEDFDGIRIIATGNGKAARLIVARTSGGTSPIYVSANGEQFCATWKFEEAVALLERPQPNIDICRLILKEGNRQIREQIIEGVFALWPGESVAFDHGGLKFAVCDSIAVARPGAFSERARATDAFMEAVTDVLEPLLTRAKRPLLEFSGGMDSTCVALAASSVREPLESYGVIQPGAAGRQQRTRREELIDLLKMTDYTGSSASVLPIDALSHQECQLTPNDDVYRICLMNTLRDHDLTDVDLVISGLGGDELAKEHTFYRKEWEVPGHASFSALVGSMGRFDMFMRRGIWPLNPFAHPTVVNLCRAMPAAMRENRLFNRLAIARAGLSDGYMTPRFHENFAGVLMLQAIECDFDRFFETSVLGDYAIIDVSELLSKAHAKTELGIPIKLIGKMYFTIKLEMVLRQYVK